MTTTEHAFTTSFLVDLARGLLRRRPNTEGGRFHRIGRCWLLAALAIFMAGCANRKPLAPDPFFGPTAVPPPATGCAQAPRDSYLATSEKVPAATVAMPADRNNAATSTSVAATPAPAVDRRENDAVSTSAIWQTGPTASGAIRTRVRPPDYASAAPSQPAEATDSAVASRPSTSATASPGSGDGTTTVTQGEPIVCVIQPLASASRKPTGAAETTSAALTSSLAPNDAAFAKRNATNTAFAERNATLASPTGLEVAGPVASAAAWTSRSGDPSTASGAVPAVAAASADVSARSSGQFLRRIVLPARATDIMDLPDVPGRPQPLRRVDPGVRLASATAPAAGSQAYVWPARAARGVNGGARQSVIQNRGSTTASTTPSLRYSYDPAYGWLRGRLEYSEVARRWKLRYIPIDGRVDPYGGSVVLGESTLLSGRQKGDFVEVRGRLLTGENGHWGYAPVYQVAQLRPIGR